MSAPKSRDPLLDVMMILTIFSIMVFFILTMALVIATAVVDLQRQSSSKPCSCAPAVEAPAADPAVIEDVVPIVVPFP
jgi:hypothetical protein